MLDEFISKDGTVLKGNIIKAYKPYEANEVRYIFIAEDRKEYRCIRKDNKYVEYVA